MKKRNLIVGIFATAVGVVSLLAVSKILGAIMIILGAVNLYAAFKKDPPEVEPEQRQPEPQFEMVDVFNVAGSEHYQREIKAALYGSEPYTANDAKEMFIEGSIGDHEPLYVYDMDESTPELVPEPDNEHDSNAIAVYVHGEKVGYIPRRKQAEVRDFTGRIVATIFGGDYFMIDLKEDYDELAEYFKKSDLKAEKFKESLKVSIKLLKPID